MSISSNKSFFKQYARSGYLNKINPQFQGVAKKYYKEKKEHNKVHQMKDKLDKEVAFMERMEKKLELNLKKKKSQLQLTLEVNNRFKDDLKKREWLHQYLDRQQKLNQEKAILIKTQSVKRVHEAKNFLLQNKRSLANLNRFQVKKLKQAQSLKKAKQWDANRSRVSSIENYKKQVKNVNNKFYQSQTDRSLKNYQTRIQSYKKYQEQDSEKIKELQQKLTKIKEKYTGVLSDADSVIKQIQKAKKQASLENNLIRSRLKSRSSVSLDARSQTSPKGKRSSESALGFTKHQI